MLLTDGPFIDSKEYLAGLFLIEPRTRPPGRSPSPPNAGHATGNRPTPPAG
jgi:hypothetical protein